MRRALPLSRLPPLPLADRGLSAVEAHERRQRYGPNDIVETPANPLWRIVRDTAHDPMIWFLFGIGALYGALGQWIESMTLLVAIVPLVGMDAVLHWRPRASTAGLSSRLAVCATVVRDGSIREIPAVELVPGDLALINPGEPFPANGILVAAHRLQVDESALSGEAYPVRKRALAELVSDEAEPSIDGKLPCLQPIWFSTFRRHDARAASSWSSGVPASAGCVPSFPPAAAPERPMTASF